MNSRHHKSMRHRLRKSLPGGVTWAQFDESVYESIARIELYRKLVDDNLYRIHATHVRIDMQLSDLESRDLIELSIRELMRKKRIAPPIHSLMTMKRAESIAAKEQCEVADLFRRPRT